MRQYYIDAETEDEIFEYWIQEWDDKNKNISKLINLLEGSERLEVGDIISIEFDTRKIGFKRSLQEDYNAYHFKIDHKKFTYMFLYSNDKLDLFEEYILIPIPKKKY